MRLVDRFECDNESVRARLMISSLIDGSMADSRLNAKAEPTCTPAAPAASASPNRSGEPYPPASQNGMPSAAERVEIDRVARPIDRLSFVVEHQRRARWGIVPTSDGSLDHEAVRPPMRAFGEEARQRVRGDDSDEERPNELWRRRSTQERHGVEAGQPLVVRRSTCHRDAVCRRLPGSKQVEDVGDLLGYSGSHQHGVDPGQHGAVQRVEHRELDLLEIVDPHQAVVAFLGKPDLGEVGEHGQIDQRPRRIEPLCGHHEIALPG